ncbi:MAG: hydroxymethylglutaryl-CoA lyase [Aestuariivita sp.]|nr:hydroxymethylglutaryl-CoA lyase [Aestuariivita sp.]
MSAAVIVREVGPRDGLQLVNDFLPTNSKLEWITQQAGAGFSEIEVTSFVPPKLMPQFADAENVIFACSKLPNMVASALALNLKGVVRALDAGADVVNFVLSASEEHSHSNARTSTDEAISVFKNTKEWQRKNAPNSSITVAIATSFGCSLQGDVPEYQVAKIAAQLAEFEPAEITLADTVGYANPLQVKRIFKAVAAEVGNIPLAAHFHDTRGLGLANVVAALDVGVRKFDAALAGLGGCPFAPGASGNIATEDTVYMLETLGMRTGINLEALMKLREDFALWLPNEPLQGRLGSAGFARTFTYAA